MAFAPWEPTALDELAQRQLGRDDANLDSVGDLARRALLSRPLDSRALSLLGGVAQQIGDPVRTEALMRLSATRSWRNPAPHIWLLAREIRQGRFEEALVQADGLMRVNFRYEYMIFPILALLGTDPRGVAALEGALTAHPPWRPSFLGTVVVNGENDQLMMQLYQSLLRSSPPLSVPELKSYLGRLIRLGRYEQAYQDWRAWRSTAEIPARPFTTVISKVQSMGCHSTGALMAFRGLKFGSIAWPIAQTARRCACNFRAHGRNLATLGKCFCCRRADIAWNWRSKQLDCEPREGSSGKYPALNPTLCWPKRLP